MNTDSYLFHWKKYIYRPQTYHDGGVHFALIYTLQHLSEMSLGLIFSLQPDKKSAVASRRIRLERFTAMKGGNKRTQRNYKRTFPPRCQHAVFHLERFKHFHFLSFASFDILYARILHFTVFHPTSVQMTINFFHQAGNLCNLFDFVETDLMQFEYCTVISRHWKPSSTYIGWMVTEGWTNSVNTVQSDERLNIVLCNPK